MIDTLKTMLFEKFVDDILTNPTRWLDDRIVQLAQILIKEKYPHINGLKYPAAIHMNPLMETLFKYLMSTTNIGYVWQAKRTTKSLYTTL